MPIQRTKMAIAYDFDGTLALGNMQEHSFIPALGDNNEQFWNNSRKIAQENDMDNVLAYMHLILTKARENKVPVRKKDFIEHGKNIKLFAGVDTWFNRINKYAKSKNIDIEHYIISSGLREMIAGTKIKNEFKYIFASGYKYDHNDVAEYPALAINYTTKTQYLFRINKGILNSWEDTKINEFTPENQRPIPFKNIIFIGDGDTDIPAMKMVNYQGGHSIAVYKKQAKQGNTHKKAQELVKNERATICAEANYSKDSELDKAVTSIIDKIAINTILSKMR